MAVVLYGCGGSEREQPSQGSDNGETGQEGQALSDEDEANGSTNAQAERNQRVPSGDSEEDNQAIQLDMNETGEREKRMPETTGDLGPAGFLLPEGRITTVRPRDFVLGPLALGQPGSPGSATSQKDATPSRQEELAISELVRSFFTADSFELQYIAPEEKKRLQWTLGNRWRPVEKVRLAPPEQLEDGRWRLRVRLLSSGGDAVGEVYVEEEKANWYITEVAIDFSELDTSGPDRRFEPGNVRASGGL